MPQRMDISKTKVFIDENENENVVCKMWAILP